MYKITLSDNVNSGGWYSGVFSCYCDDLDQFEQDWMQLEPNEETRERFRRSKAGEVVTDCYSDDPACNIVQEDQETEIYFKHMIIHNRNVLLHNAYGGETQLHFGGCELDIRYVKFQGEFLRLVKYKLTGVCRDSLRPEIKYISVPCFGNHVLKCHSAVEYHGSDELEDFDSDTIECIAYLETGRFESLEALREDYERVWQNCFEEDELDQLFRDIPGEAG